MHTTSFLFLLTSAAALLPIAHAADPGDLQFCFNGGNDDASCITTQTLFDGACKRPPVMNAPGKKIVLSKVTVSPWDPVTTPARFHSSPKYPLPA